MKPIVNMSVAELCEAIKVEGERLGVKVWIDDGSPTAPNDAMVLLPSDTGAGVIFSWDVTGSYYYARNLRKGLRRWVSLRGKE